MVYELCLNGEKRGYATTQRQGLYYKIECQCELAEAARFRVTACGDRGEADLGLLIPQGKYYALHTSVAMKRLGDNLTFRLEPTHKSPSGTFFPIIPEEQFAYLSRLRESVLLCIDGRVGIVLQDQKSESSNPTGQ